MSNQVKMLSKARGISSSSAGCGAAHDTPPPTLESH